MMQTPSPLHLTEAAKRNHDALWPDYRSTVQETDPDLIQIFDNWAFDEVIAHDKLDVKIRMMVIMASNIACQALTEYKMFVSAALQVGVSPVQIKEVLYQAVPYVGVAKVIDFLHALNEVFTRQGIALPLPTQTTTAPATRFENGLAVQKTIFGDIIDQLYANSPENQLHIQHYLSANCFGDYLTRSGLDLPTRELLTYSMLISMGGADAQVKGHVRGNANLGNDKQLLIDVTTQLLPYIGYPRTINALACLNEVLPE